MDPESRSKSIQPKHSTALLHDATSEHPLNGAEDSTSDIDETNLIVMSGRPLSSEEVQPIAFAQKPLGYTSGDLRRLSGDNADSQSRSEGDETRARKKGVGQPSPFSRSFSSRISSETPNGTLSRPPFLARHSRSMRLASEASIGTGLEGRRGSLGEEAETIPTWRATAVGATPLERTMDAIGMGRYQYAVLVLSGLGWAADNMWLQGVAITLPRIQDEWGIRDQWIGLVSSSTFAGMMVGALAWGSYADTFGRKNAFNLTLLITAVFGLLSSFAPNFPSLCLCLFALGTGVGGSMPTDGTIFLEAVPKRNHYLLTALSVFFAAGSVVASVLGYVIIPQNSCGGAPGCDSQHNKGWRYLLSSLGGLTMLFVIARLVFFTLFESPKYLVSAGKHEEAREVLQRIAAFNGEPKRVRLSDVSDRQSAQASGSQTGVMPNTRQERPKSSVEGWRRAEHQQQSDRLSIVVHPEDEQRQQLLTNAESRDSDEEGGRRHSFGGHEYQHDATWSNANQRGSSKMWPASLGWIPISWRPSLQDSVSRYEELFSPYWRKTTILVWAIWTIFTLAFTMVNVFLPKYLESRRGHSPTPSVPVNDSMAREQAMRAVLRDFLFYTLASLPGSLLGAFLIETPLGRIKSMAISTLLLALSLLAFAMSVMPFFVVLSSCSISLFASVAYAVIYSYSPEVFKTGLRGTASGTASALSRLAGILAPVIAGALMQIAPNIPLYLGFALFAVTVWLQLSLPFETRGRHAEEGEEAEDDHQ